MEYKQKLKKYNLKVSDIAGMIGAKNEISFRNSTAFKRYMKFFVSISEHVEQHLIKKINE